MLVKYDLQKLFDYIYFDEGDNNLSYITCDKKGNALTLELRIL